MEFLSCWFSFKCVFWNISNLQKSCIYIVKLTLKLFYLQACVHMQSLTCHSPGVVVRGTTCRSWFSPPPWDPGIELKLSGLCGKSFDKLSHLGSLRPSEVCQGVHITSLEKPCSYDVLLIFSFGHPFTCPNLSLCLLLSECILCPAGFPCWVTPLMWIPQSFSPCWRVYAKRSFQNVPTLLWLK